MPATINMYGESDYLTAPLASVEDLSRVNTPGGSPSLRPRSKHPALEDPNWEPPEEPTVQPQDVDLTIEPTALTPLQPAVQDQHAGLPDRIFFQTLPFCFMFPGLFGNVIIYSFLSLPGLKLVFMTLVLHGVGTLMPWNMFITAKNYFVDYKLVGEDGEVSSYATNFLPYIGYAAQIPNVLFNWLNIFIQFGGNLTTRIVWSILIEVVVFVFTVVLAMVDSSEWPGVFFWITIASVVILNVANGIYQNTVYGMAARLPFAYTGAVVLGSNISGTFTAIINILSIGLAPNIRTSAIYYFITALFVLLACFDTYFALPLNRFFRYHEAQHERAKKAAKRDPSKPRIPYGHIFKKAFPQLFNVFLVFFVTLSVFPAVLADTCRTEENFPVPPKYYQAVTCFLTFNLFAMLGNMLPGLITWPSPRFLCIPVILRIFLIPAFVLCHFYPVNVERVMPVLIDSDWAYWVLAVILGLTSGYYSSLAMMYCPRTVEPEYAPVAGMMGAASLITGIFAGINFQIVCTWAVTKISFEIPGYEFPMRNCTDRLS
ncbi:equilibrative nucleoside transporter 1-like [Macrobrachium nipponense]|uniref:equilibrative nucleoside transporter 1-like n=1 Tax=Macrobrachium nipponense TaxID=159736 RepID=UPI0030C7F82E